MTSTPSREPAGVPTGGRFSSHPAPEAGHVDLGQLTTDDEHNAEGTYAFPPSPRNAAQAISFWVNVPVPDLVLANVRNRYNARSDFRGQQAEMTGRRLGLTARVRTAKETASEQATRGTGHLGNAPLRSIVRIANLHWYAESLPSDERDKVEGTRFTLDNGWEVTPAELVEHLDLGTMGDAFEDRYEADTLDTLAAMRDLLARGIDSV